MALSERVKGVALTYVFMVLRNGVAILIIPFIIASVGVGDYGVYSLVASIIGYLIIMELGLSNTAVRFLAKYKASGDKESEALVFGMITLLYGVVAVLSLLVAVIFYKYIDTFFAGSLTRSQLKLLEALYIVLVVNVMIVLLSNSITGVIISRERFGFMKLLDIASFVLRTVMIVVLLKLEYGVMSIAVTDTILNLIASIVKLLYVTFRIDIGWRLGWDIKLFKQILIYGSFISLGAIVNQVNWRADPFVLGAIVGAEAVAIYNIGLQFVLAYIAIAAAITNVFLPKFVNLVENGASTKTLNDNLIRIGRYQFIMLGFFMVSYAALGYELINRLFGEGFFLSFLASIVVMVPFTLVLIQGAANCILQALNKHKVKSVVLILFALFNLSLSIFMAEAYGVVGVAAATALSIVLGDLLVMGVYLQRYIGLDMVGFYKKCSGILVLVAAIVGAFYVIDPKVTSWGHFLMYLFVLNFIYVVSVWCFVLTKEDRYYFAFLFTTLTARARSGR